MAAEKSSKTAKSVMDVSKPGKSAPAATSRPVIIGHGPMVQDQTVRGDGLAVEPEGEKINVSRTQTKVIAPPEQGKEDTPIVSDSAPQSEEVPETASDEQASATAEEKVDGAQSENTESTNTEETGAKDENAVVDAVIDQAQKDKNPAAVSEEDKKKQEEIDKLVESKKYFVSIGQDKRRRRSKSLLVSLLMLLLLAGGYIAADRFTDWPLPYEFFKEAQSESTALNQTNTEARQSQQPEDTQKEFTSKEVGVSFMHPKDWAVEFKAHKECPALASDFEGQQNNTTNAVLCPYDGTIWFDKEANPEHSVGLWVFENSTKALSEIYKDQVSALSSEKHEIFKTTSGLNAIFVNQPLEATNSTYSDNIYVIELVQGTYLWVHNREYTSTDSRDATASTPGSEVTDLRKYSQQVRNLVNAIKYDAPDNP